MKILFYDMGAYTQNDIAYGLSKLGIEYKNILYRLYDVKRDKYFKKRITELLEEYRYDAVLSVNYFPILAEICCEHAIPYLSWSYDSPLIMADMEDTLGYKTNYIFLFDRAECNKLWRKGYENVFHLPLAVNTERLDKTDISSKDMEKYGADVSLVGQLYDSSLPTLMMPLSDYDKGYITALVESQIRLYGCYLLDEAVNNELLLRMNAAYKRLGQNKCLLTKEGLSFTLAKHITHMERILLLDMIGERFNTKLFGPDKPESLHGVIWCGSAGYFDEMPKVFKSSKINLNVSLKCIQTGIPLRALDIMGCGGFLLTNYQEEIAEYFIDGEEVVMYTSIEDAFYKCQYFLEHEEERNQIALNGYQKVKEQFYYGDRIRSMFQIAGLLS